MSNKIFKIEEIKDVTVYEEVVYERSIKVSFYPDKEFIFISDTKLFLDDQFVGKEVSIDIEVTIPRIEFYDFHNEESINSNVWKCKKLSSEQFDYKNKTFTSYDLEKVEVGQEFWGYANMRVLRNLEIEGIN